MNRSKIIGATALASVMAAGAAQAEMSLSGYFAGTVSDNDGGGIASTFSTNSFYISYSDSMDNGMGVGLTMSVTAAGIKTDVNFDTGMGTIGLGTGQDSAVDKMDGSPAIGASLNAYGPRFSAAFNDGDASSGASLMYTTPSINGWTIGASIGENGGNSDRVTSVAVKGSIAGVSVAAGAVDAVGANDDSFVTLGYSVAGVGLGYGAYDSDEDEVTIVSAKTSVAGMTVGMRYEDLDASTDNTRTLYSVGKDFGGMSLTLMFEEQDAADNEEWNLVYAMGF